MSLDGLEHSLARLPDIGTPIKLRPYRQIWRFDHNDQILFLKFFPRRGQRLKRLIRGDPAQREFKALQRLQKSHIPSPIAVAHLIGFSIKGEKGDAVLSHALEPSETLDHHLHAQARSNQKLSDAQHRHLVTQISTLLQSLAQNNLGHTDLHLGNLLHSPPLPDPTASLYLLDAYALTTTGLTISHLQTLAYAAAHTATRTDLLRVWQKLYPPNTPLPPAASPVAKRHWRKTVERATTESAYAGKTRIGPHTVTYFKQHKFPPLWSPASALTITAEDWQREWPRLLAQINADTLYPLKRSPSADILKTEIILAGVPTTVVIKRPFRRYWYRYLTELPRGTRAYRAWWKSWALLARGIPTAWPLACIETKTAGVVTDQFLICEFVPGTQLDQLDITALDPTTRRTLFHRVGRLLRRIDETGLVHFDTKASNFLITNAATSPLPILVDVDGVRSYSWRGEGLRRLTASLQRHQPRLQPQDLLHLRIGYDPFNRNQ